MPLSERFDAVHFFGLAVNGHIAWMNPMPPWRADGDRQRASVTVIHGRSDDRIFSEILRERQVRVSA